jgi:TetR/AcrR family transcriptional regulator, transcriptional repressor for nem operon
VDGAGRRRLSHDGRHIRAIIGDVEHNAGMKRAQSQRPARSPAPAIPPAHPASSSRADGKHQTHRRIVSSASRLMRRHGLTRASVMDVMRGAGLTVGGFYAHFRSKRAMDLEVLEQTFDEVRARSDARLADAAGLDRLERAVGHYLSASHRDRPEDGCPLPSVVADLAHADPELRLALGRFFDRWADRLSPHAPAMAHASARERALATIALCVGGVTIARALRGQPLSDELLHACAAWAVPERSPATAASSRRRPPRRRRRLSRR